MSQAIGIDVDRHEPLPDSQQTEEPASAATPEAIQPVVEPPAASAGSREPPVESSETTHATAPEEATPDSFSLILRNGLDLPIPGLDVFVVFPSGRTCRARTSAEGAATVPLPAEPRGEAKVEVSDVTGRRQQVCTVDLASCKNAVIVRSPKVKAVLPLRPHHQQPPVPKSVVSTPAPSAATAGSTSRTGASTAADDWWSENGAIGHAWAWLKESLGIDDHAPVSRSATPLVAKTLDLAGHPVVIVAGPECPNKDCLRLGRNNVYRQPLLDAAKRLGLIPQSLCALIDCEASKVTERIPRLGPDGQQLKDKKGKLSTTQITELWKADSGNAQSNAAGLTQFLRGTWLDHVKKPGYYIHEQSKAKGWVRLEPEPPPPGKVRAALQRLPGVKPRLRWVFVLSDGTTVVDARKALADANVQACLAMRNDPTWSINAAADYGIDNLRVLSAKGFKLSALNDMDKAKLMYVMHHEGEGAGPLFVANRLSSGKHGIDGLRGKFAAQLGGSGEDAAKRLIDQAAGDVEVAYRKWLAKYVDDKFNAAEGRYFCSDPIRSTELSDLLETIGGKVI